MIAYDDVRKALPAGQLHALFEEAGWIGEGETEAMRAAFTLPFLNSTLVISAWDGGRLVGAVRVLSDGVVRSVVYDLVVAREYRGRGIGSELLSRCIAHWPGSEWLIPTEAHIASFYERLGFERSGDAFMLRRSEYF
ncbi:MAG: GNAT family N-acetyltransferase [Candidatus Fimadaptatus sp.]